MATSNTAAARPAVNTFDIIEVQMAAGRMDAIVAAKDSAGRLVKTFQVSIGSGNGLGVRFAADGAPEPYVVTNGTITLAAAFTAFVGAAGGFAAKAAALETWCQGKGLIPS